MKIAKNGPVSINKKILVFRCAIKILSTLLCKIELCFSIEFSDTKSSIILSSFFYYNGSFLLLLFLPSTELYLLILIIRESICYKTLSFNFDIKCLRLLSSILKMPLESISKDSANLSFIKGLYKSWKFWKSSLTMSFSSSRSRIYHHLESYWGISRSSS